MWKVAVVGLLAGCTASAPALQPLESVSDLADTLDQADPNSHTKLLFVIGAKKGTVMRVSDTRHEFSFKKEDIAASIAFTDRPERRSFDLPLPIFEVMWNAGKDSFEADPPNAVLKDDGSEIAITELTGLVHDSKTLTFYLDRNAYKKIDSSDGLGTALKNPTLFIDSLITTAGVAGLLRAGAKACAETECYLALCGG